MAGCRSRVDCITGHIGADKRPEAPGYKRICPFAFCGGEMSIDIGDNAPLVFRCHRNRGHDQVDLHKKMVEIFGRDCITGRPREKTPEQRQIAEIKQILITEPAGTDRDLHVAEVLYQRKEPTGRDEWLEFAELAGIPRSTRYKRAPAGDYQPRRT